MAREVVVHAGDREPLRWLFEIAEDSAELLDGYIDAGEVLLARLDGRDVGLAQLTSTDDALALEINILAVAPDAGPA